MKYKIVLSLLLLFGGVNIAYSCTCEQISHKKEYKSAKVIFVGKVTDISIDESYKPPQLSESHSSSLREKVKENKRIIVKFSVLEQFKGKKIKEGKCLLTLAARSIPAPELGWIKTKHI